MLYRIHSRINNSWIDFTVKIFGKVLTIKYNKGENKRYSFVLRTWEGEIPSFFL